MHPPQTDTPCPDENLLATFVEGGLTFDEARGLEMHVDACARCCHLLAVYAKPGGPAHEAPGTGTPAGTSLSAQSDGRLVERLQRGKALAPGTLVGRYMVLTWVGEGAAGVVYAAYDPELDRRIALKLMRPDVHDVDAERSAKTLLREARAMAKLAHPNVIGVHDVGTFETDVFLAMEFAEGATLRQWLETTTPGPTRIVEAFLEAGRGLAAAHAAGLVHRDFKPENVLVTKSGRVKVGDFGLARLLEPWAEERAPAQGAHPHGSARTPEGSARSDRAGTPAFMAPEQKRGHADARSDQFSFCVAFYEALTGHHPFAPDGNLDAGAFAERAGRIPPSIRNALARGLRVDAKDRYPSMEELLAELAAPQRGRRWRVLASVALGVAAAAAIALGVRGRPLPPPLLCKGSEAKLNGVWDQATKESARRAFTAIGRPFAQDAWGRAEKTLDSYAADWIAARTDVCEATRVRGEQSEAALDLRMECLDDRLKDLGALAEVLVHADEQVATNAVQASESLRPLATCGDIKALSSRTRAPDPATAARVADLRERLQRIEALNVAGKYADALPLASQLADEAQATRFEPVQAEALFTYGDLRGKTGDFAGAEETLHRAALVADAAADDRTRAEAYGGLLVYAGREEAKRDLIPRLRDEGTAALTRLGVHDDTEALFFSDLGIALQSQGQFEDAREAYEHALALLEKLHGDENARVAGTLNGLAGSYTSLGDYDHAIALYERALATASRTLGPNHPRLSSMQSGLGWALSEQLEFAEAEGHFRAAVAIAEATLGPDHPRLAAYLDNLGESLSDQGKYADAVPIHERALAIRERFYKPDHPLLRDSLEGLGRALIGLGNAARAVPYLERALKLPGTGTATDNAEVEFTLAQAVAASGGSPKRAISLARAARDSYEASSRGPLEGRKLAAIRDWLARPPR